MNIKPEPFGDVSYPVMEKGWKETKIEGQENNEPFHLTIYSKQYHDFLIDVVLMQKRELYLVGGRVFDLEKKIKINTFNRKKPKLFLGKNASLLAAIAVREEKKEMEQFVDLIK